MEGKCFPSIPIILIRRFYYEKGSDRTRVHTRPQRHHEWVGNRYDPAVSNSMIAKQKKEPGEAFVSTVLFDSYSEVIHDRLKLENVPALTEKEYQVCGCTALLDAIGGAIHHIANIRKYARPEDVPEHTMLIITTDGMENASRHYSIEKVRSMIETEKEKYGWEFLFLGTNIDAIETARHIGIDADHAADYCCDSAGTAVNYECLNKAVTAFRCAAPIGAAWKKDIEEDYKRRKK